MLVFTPNHSAGKRQTNHRKFQRAFFAPGVFLLLMQSFFPAFGYQQSSANAGSSTWPIISEFVIDHNGTDTHEFIEVFGQDRTSYSNFDLLVIDGETNPGQVLASFNVGQTGSAGFWDTGFLNDSLPNGSLTIACVSNFSGSVGTDLDTDDDGSFDITPWSSLTDDIAVSDGDPDDKLYSLTVLTGTGQKRGGSLLGGASRHPYGLDTDQPSDWIRNDFDGAGLPGFVGTWNNGEARNTPGSVTNLTTDDYYASADASSSANLRTSVHDIIDDHAKFPYTSSFEDSWDVLNRADQDPNQPGNILSVYINASYPKQSGGNSLYNREHTWPKSYGFPDNENSAYPYTDFHHLRLSNISANGNRANIAFGNCNGSCNEQVTQVNNGQGGGSGMYPGNSNWYSGSSGSGNYEVWHFRRGDVARTMLYMDLRYEGDMHQVRQTLEPNLILTDNTSLIQTSGGTNTTGNAYMGRLSVLLQWHRDDPVDDIERRRNDIIYASQGNRNPFVDHPEWADCLFDNNCQQLCVVQWYASWLVQPSPCSAGNLDMLGLVSIVNEDCGCTI